MCRSPASVALAVAVAAALPACSGEDDAPSAVACRLQVDPEVVLGFQGLLFFVVHLQGAGLPAEGLVTYTIRVGGGPAHTSRQPRVITTQPPDAERITEEIWIFLDGDLANNAGQTAALAIRYEGEERLCAADATVDLVDDDPCLHSFDGPICP